jgi:predicted protein tyrosine phosphatase
MRVIPVMPRPSLLILGYSEASMFLRTAPPKNISAIISIHGAREHPVKLDISHRLDLTFDDVDLADPNDPIALQRAHSRKRWLEQCGLPQLPPTSADAAAIINFAQRIRHLQGPVLVHCGAGMSRSPAAALICLAVWHGPGSESDCVAQIQTLRRGAVPHPGLIRFADELLGRDNKLLAAVRAAR